VASRQIFVCNFKQIFGIPMRIGPAPRRREEEKKEKDAMRTTIPNCIRCFTSSRLFLPLAALAFVTFVLGLYPQSVFAQSSPGGGVDDSAGPFQLESNATTDTAICFQVGSSGALVATPSGTNCPIGFTYIPFAAASDDWQNGLGFGGGASHALATSFVGPASSPVAEQVNSLNDTTFFAGGSKDTLGISSGPWEYQVTSTPAKDDIEHAYAAAYTMLNSHTAIYFGMDRVDNSGDATAGFWFFQDSSISLSTQKKGGGFLFSGHHANGDLLIVADFSIGGAVGSIQAFTWSCPAGPPSATCDSKGSLVSATALNTNGTCNPITGSSSFCAIVNDTDGLTAPWGFVDTKNVATTFSHGEFLEGGIDLETIFGNTVPCFSTFMAETRSSNKPDSALQDVTPPVSFPLCGIRVEKNCNGAGLVSADGTSVAYSYSATVTNTGIGSVFNVSLHDTLPDGTVTDITVPLPDTCNSIPNSCLGPKHTATVSSIAFTATTSNCKSGVTNCPTPLDAINTTTAKAFTAASGGTEIDSASPAATAECKATVSSTVTIEKHCDASKGGATLVATGGVVEVEVFYVAKVCNTGTSQLTSINLADDHNSTSDSPNPSSISSLAPGACTNLDLATDTSDIKGSYFPNSIDSTTGRFAFTDTIRVTSAKATIGPNPTPVAGCPSTTDLACAPITCPICFDSVCTGNPQP
jgi:hypothetical protein